MKVKRILAAGVISLLVALTLTANEIKVDLVNTIIQEASIDQLQVKKGYFSGNYSVSIVVAIDGDQKNGQLRVS